MKPVRTGVGLVEVVVLESGALGGARAVYSDGELYVPARGSEVETRSAAIASLRRLGIAVYEDDEGPDDGGGG